jgi:NAD(P)-dependent dehydrogenase (short-subunit alcohol dehydrogenase family)
MLFKIGRSVHVTPTSRARLRAASHRHEAWTEDRASTSPHLHDTRDVHKKNHGEIAVILGAGPGLGHALAWRLANAGMAVVLASRNAKRLDALAADIVQMGGAAFAYGCDATDEASVASLFKHVQSQHGTPHLVVYALQNFGPGNLIDIELCAFEDGWRHNCLGAFLVARQAARAMLSAARGSIIFIGSTSSLLGRAGHLNLAVGKFGQRAIAQVLAREL